MVRRRVFKRKKSTRLPNNFIQTISPSSKEITHPSQNREYRPYEHPYATRSKTLRIAQSSMDINDTEEIDRKLKRRKSDSSIVFLGTYRKSPQLVVLHESSEGRWTEFVEKPEALICLKSEKVHLELINIKT